MTVPERMCLYLSMQGPVCFYLRAPLPVLLAALSSSANLCGTQTA